MHKGIVTHVCLGHKGEADFLDHATEVDAAHSYATLVVDRGNPSGNRKTHVRVSVQARSVADFM